MTEFRYNVAMKLDGAKEKLSEFRFYRGIVVGLIIGIGGSLLLRELSNTLIIYGICALIILTMIWLWLSLAISDKIKEIERL